MIDEQEPWCDVPLHDCKPGPGLEGPRRGPLCVARRMHVHAESVAMKRAQCSMCGDVVLDHPEWERILRAEEAWDAECDRQRDLYGSVAG